MCDRESAHFAEEEKEREKNKKEKQVRESCCAQLMWQLLFHLRDFLVIEIGLREIDSVSSQTIIIKGRVSVNEYFLFNRDNN